MIFIGCFLIGLATVTGNPPMLLIGIVVAVVGIFKRHG